MTTLIILLRIIHIFGGAFWIGVGLFNIGFLIPTIKATGPEGQKVMQHLTQKTRFQTMVYTAATLTNLSASPPVFLFLADESTLQRKPGVYEIRD